MSPLLATPLSQANRLTSAELMGLNSGGFAWEVMRRLAAYCRLPREHVPTTVLRGGTSPVVLIEPHAPHSANGLLFR